MSNDSITKSLVEGLSDYDKEELVAILADFLSRTSNTGQVGFTDRQKYALQVSGYFALCGVTLMERKYNVTAPVPS